MKKVTLVEVNNVMEYPPIISLIENLLANNNMVKLISFGNEGLPNIILKNKNFLSMPLSTFEKGDTGKNILKHIIQRKTLTKEVEDLVEYAMLDSDILWTTSSNTVRILGKRILKYKNVMQLMELIQYGYWYKRLLKYPIGEYAKKSWKVVVPEENRAYIEKVWWDLPQIPYILPNKPYCLECGEPTQEMFPMLNKIKNEKRKILLYLGGIWPDRDLKPFIDASKKCGDEYCIYIIGKAYDSESNRQLEDMLKEDNVEYLGFFKSPKHLAFLQYAYAGILPYRPSTAGVFSELNALYCAPNKIYEYAGFGIPMVGTDVPGLKYPFEQFNIGRCCNGNNVDSIVDAIKKVEANYDHMSSQCKVFYDDIDLDKIVNCILNE